ncbi:unnamed protein product [Fraxinus pennsylvanica]|uniref:Uncharacterized protein n=1 Tax=Fraxinus pennsylvanica TaxID=56036 RepID=A0AAD2DYS7_9LAMI|nr:unnamed protein product [Fraxinus pennsylvanica]
MTSSASFDSSSKKVVQFRPPPIVNFISNKVKDEEEDSDEDEKEKQRKKVKRVCFYFICEVVFIKYSCTQELDHIGFFTFSFGSFLGQTRMGPGRAQSSRSGSCNIITNASASNLNSVGTMVSDADVKSSIGYSENQSGDGSSLSYDHSNWNSGNESYSNYDGYGADYDDSVGTGERVHYSNWNGQTGDYANYGAGFGNYGQDESNWIDESGSTAVAEGSELAESGLQVPGKRGRNDAPEHIVDVKQDELLKNQPRMEDQAKLTGLLRLMYQGMCLKRD